MHAQIGVQIRTFLKAPNVRRVKNGRFCWASKLRSKLRLELTGCARTTTFACKPGITLCNQNRQHMASQPTGCNIAGGEHCRSTLKADSRPATQLTQGGYRGPGEPSSQNRPLCGRSGRSSGNALSTARAFCPALPAQTLFCLRVLLPTSRLCFLSIKGVKLPWTVCSNHRRPT